MDFKNTERLKSYRLTIGRTFIDRQDVIDSMRNEYLHDLHSHFIVSKEGNYDDIAQSKGLVPERIIQLQDAFNSGHTIVVKEMENWNQNIKRRCREFQSYVDVHMYVTPANGSAFDWHTDDKHVYIHMQIGEKNFDVEEPNGEITNYCLKPGQVLFIPYGARHRAVGNNGASVHLGFGVWPDEVTVKGTYENFEVPMELKL